MLPDLKVVSRRPDWMTTEVVAKLKRKMHFDADKPRGWLAQLDRGEDIAAG